MSEFKKHFIFKLLTNFVKIPSDKNFIPIVLKKCVNNFTFTYISKIIICIESNNN